ncbi:MAG: hypothetical protein QMC96_11025 [Methanomicrobiales archaeon]|nr:hypothetical protein [Methanomicrobiales archaeon]
MGQPLHCGKARFRHGRKPLRIPTDPPADRLPPGGRPHLLPRPWALRRNPAHRGEDGSESRVKVPLAISAGIETGARWVPSRGRE